MYRDDRWLMIDEDAGGRDGADEIDKKHIKAMLSQEWHLESCLQASDSFLCCNKTSNLNPIKWLDTQHFVAIL